MSFLSRSIFTPTYYVCHDDEHGKNFKCENFTNFNRALKYYDNNDRNEKSRYIRYIPTFFPLNIMPHSVNTTVARIFYILNLKGNTL